MPDASQENTNVPCNAEKRLLVIRNYLGILGRELRWPLTRETVALLAKEVYRDEVEQRGKEALDIGEGAASGTIDPRLETINSYLFEVAGDEQIAETMVRLVQRYGLLYQPVPGRGKTARVILSQAKAKSAQAAKATFRALVRTIAPAELERRVEAASQLAQAKSESEIYQTMRGDRVIPRFLTHEGRQVSPAGPRPEHEVTAFLQVAARYLETHVHEWDFNASVDCLATVRCIAEGELSPSLPSIQIMKERNRVRMKEATLLKTSDYQVAISVALGVDSSKNLRRQRAFYLSMAVLNTLGVSTEDQQRAETELARLFGVT